MVQDHELVGVRVRQRAQEHGVDDGEHGDVGADAERERQQRRDGEGGLAHELTERVADR